MSKFNIRTRLPTVFSAVRTENRPSGLTHEAGDGYARDAKSELFLLAVSQLAGEDTFYESGEVRNERFANLVGSLVRSEEFDWLYRLFVWLRGPGNLRTVSLVGAAVAVHASLHDGRDNPHRRLIAAVCRRADEPGEMLAVWTSTYGRNIPKPVKRGIADAAVRLYTESTVLKYDSEARGFRFADVLELTHPKAADDKQSALFGHVLDRRFNDVRAPEELETMSARRKLHAVPVEQRRELLGGDLFSRAGMTWESTAGWLQGSMDAEVWEALIPSMGYMALLRNLRNFDRAGVSDETAQRVAAKLADPDEVERSRQLPMRFLSAYRNAPSLRWSWALERALDHSLASVPALDGSTLILVDRSGSMGAPLSARSDLDRADAAALFGTALWQRCAQADLVQFGTGSQALRMRRGESVLPVLDRFSDMGGTNTAHAVRKHYRRHSRVVIVTDEQAWGGYYGSNPTVAVPEAVPVYTWNLAGYRYGHGRSGERNRHTFGGLTDQAFRMIPLLEAGKNAQWPFSSGRSGGQRVPS